MSHLPFVPHKLLKLLPLPPAPPPPLPTFPNLCPPHVLVCSDCYELDGALVVGIIIGDLLVTGGVVILIYHWAQKKSGSLPASGKTTGGPKGTHQSIHITEN